MFNQFFNDTTHNQNWLKDEPVQLIVPPSPRWVETKMQLTEKKIEKARTKMQTFSGLFPLTNINSQQMYFTQFFENDCLKFYADEICYFTKHIQLWNSAPNAIYQ